MTISSEKAWTVRIPLREEEKEVLVSTCKRLEITGPTLIGVLLRRILRRGLLEELLQGEEELPQSHQWQRRRKRQRALLAKLGFQNSPRISEEKLLLSRALHRPEDISEGQEGSSGGRAASNVVERPSVHAVRRQDSFGELCEMIALPGRNLDSECEGALQSWVDCWGVFTEAEGAALAEAQRQRRAAYEQWREQLRGLQRQIVEVSEKAQRCADVREKRTLQRKCLNLRSELRTFKIHTRWELRDMFFDPPKD